MLNAADRAPLTPAVCVLFRSRRLGSPLDKAGWATGKEVRLQVAADPLQGTRVLPGILIEKHGAMFESQYQGLDQQRLVAQPLQFVHPTV